MMKLDQRLIIGSAAKGLINSSEITTTTTSLQYKSVVMCDHDRQCVFITNTKHIDYFLEQRTTKYFIVLLVKQLCEFQIIYNAKRICVDCCFIASN